VAEYATFTIWCNIEGREGGPREVLKTGETSMEQSRTQLLQELLKRLGQALHGTVVNSDEVRGCLRQLHEHGWDAVMMLEASVACRHDGEPELEEASMHIHADPSEAKVSFRMNLHDAAFLSSLGISPSRHRSPGSTKKSSGRSPSADSS
jgi:hypothetical protein